MSTADALATPREWVGEEAFPWAPTSSLADGDDVVACFSILQFNAARTRTDTPFLRLQLTDCYGPIEARLWDNIDDVLPLLRAGAYIGVRGSLEVHNGERQVNITGIAPLRVELDDLVLFLPRSARPAETMDAELASLIDSVADHGLRTLLALLLAPGTDIGSAFRLAPAAKQNHHAYLGGLLEHTLSMTRVCDMLATHYGAGVDRDLLIAGALLHDIGKVREIGARAGFPYTDEGKLLGHILIGMQMVADAAAGVAELPPSRLLLLQHLIASHQGRYEWHSPREPRTLEAIILHYADDLDAKLNQAGALLAAVDHGWTAYDRSFGREMLRHIPVEASAFSERGTDEAPSRPRRTAGAEARPAALSRTEETGSAEPAGLDTLDLFES